MSPSPNGTAAGPEPKRAGGLNARVVVHAVRRRPIGTAGVVALGAAAAAAVWFFLPLSKATATVVFQIASQTPALLTPTAEGRTDFNSYKQSQATLVKRRLTLNAVLKQPAVGGLETLRKATPDPLTWLDHAIKVDTKPGSEFMRVTLEGDDGEELRVLLDAVAKGYLADVDERDNGQRRRRLAKLEDTHRAYRAEQERFQKRIDAIAFALGSKDGPTLAALDTILQEDLRLAVRELSSARESQQLAEMELAGLDQAAALKSGEAAPAAPVPSNVVDEELRKDAGLRDLEAAVGRARDAVAETEKLFQSGTSSPAVVRAREQLAAAEARRDKHRTERRAQLEVLVKDGLRKAHLERRDELARTVERLKQRTQVAKGQVDAVQQRIGKSNEYRIELENLKRLIEQTDKLTARLGDEIEQIKVELGAPPRVTLAEEAYVIPGIEGSRRLKFTLIVGIAVAALGFAGLVGWEYRCRWVTHTDEVTTDIGVRLLGTVPPVAAGGDPRTGVPSKVLVEAIDTARTMLLHGTPDGARMRTVLVTSAVAGEGKTSLSGHLAISLARAGFRTLLVDGDFQSPVAHRVFALAPGPGLCELLRGQADLAAAVRSTAFPGLSVLPAGAWDLAARQALVGDRWVQTKQALEAEFDFLVVDTAPLLLVSDTLLLARGADGVILSVLLGVSQIAHVAETAGRLQAVGAKVTGAVVNGVWHKAYRSRYGYGPAEPQPAVSA